MLATRYRNNHSSVSIAARKAWHLRRTPEQIARDKENIRKSHLKRRYGLTLQQYESLLIEQGHKCAVCRREGPNGRGEFHVDHDHLTGKIRGLLCYNCNRALGLLKDDSEIVQALMAYLAKKSQVPA
jgi:Recombination endonuclease VII.